MTPAALPAPRALSTTFGLLMVAATEIQTHGLALVAAALAVTAVVAGLQFRPAATLAVMITVSAIVLSDPSPMLAALSGLSAAAYLVLRHAADSVAINATQPTVIGAVGLTSAGLVATSIPLQLPWLPLLAPVAVLAIYVIVTQMFLADRRRPTR